jgi:DnaJ-class molecular chaperone
MNDRKDYYKILGITEDEKKLQGDDFEKVVKTKYRKLAIQLHPDKQQGKSDNEKKEDILNAFNEMVNKNKDGKQSACRVGDRRTDSHQGLKAGGTWRRLCESGNSDKDSF